MTQQQRSASRVKVVLIQDHEHLGKVGDVVQVRPGHMRHDLYPNKLAAYATPGNLRRLQQQGGLSCSGAQQSDHGRASKEEQELLQALKLLTDRPVVIRRRFSRKLEGQPPVSPVGRRCIQQNVLRQLGVEVQPQLILLPNGPIRDYGEYKVVQPDAYTLAVRLRTPDRHGWLHLSWQPTSARLCMGQPPARGASSEAFSFAEQVSAALKGLVLTGVSLPQRWERVAQLSFGVRPGETPARQLMVEVQGNYSNVVLLDANGIISACGFQVGSRMSSVRLVQQGRPYQLPPIPPGIPPTAATDATTFSADVTSAAELAAGGTAGQAAAAAEEEPERPARPAPQRAPTVLAGLVRAYIGCSPSLAEQLLLGAGVEAAAHPRQLDVQQWARLHSQWLAWLERVDSGRYAACLDPDTNRYSMLGCYASPAPSPCALVDDYYRSLAAADAHAALHQRLVSALRQALKKARGRVASFTKQMDSAREVHAVQRQADIIMANVYRIPEGAALLEAEDWDTGAAVAIPLDPSKGAVEQAEALYRRARKLRRAADALAPLVAAAEEEVEYLEEVEASLSGLAAYEGHHDTAALSQVQEELEEAKLLRPPPEAALAVKGAAKARKAARKGKGGAGGGAGAGFRQFVSPGGFSVLVGRNNKQNDVLSHQVANPSDYWMHVRGAPGSHTLLRLPPGASDAPQPDLQFAADLAAYFSKARDSGKADVVVARADALKKPRGAKPGQVLVSREECNMVGRPPAGAAAACANAAAAAPAVVAV